MLHISNEFTKIKLQMESIENKVHVFKRNTDVDEVHALCDAIDEKSYENDDNRKVLILVFSDYFEATKHSEKLDIESTFLPTFLTYDAMVDRINKRFKDSHKLIAVFIDAVWAAHKELDDIHARYNVPVLAFLESPESQL